MYTDASSNEPFGEGMSSSTVVYDFDTIKELLNATTEGLLVTFTKRDGSTRKMRCSLNPKHLPEKEGQQTKPTRSASTEAISVYDLEVLGWRSFRIDSIQSVE